MPARAIPTRAEMFETFARERGLELVGSLSPGPLTPLLAEGNGAPIDPAVRGELPGGARGYGGSLLLHLRNKTFRFHVAITEVPEAQELALAPSSASATDGGPATIQSTASVRATPRSGRRARRSASATR